jgi:hypothetical protein
VTEPYEKPGEVGEKKWSYVEVKQKMLESVGLDRGDFFVNISFAK